MPYYVRLSWVDNSDNESGFVIYRRVGSGGDLTPHNYVGAGFEEFIEEVQGGQTYYYEVKAENAAGESDPTNQVVVSTFLISPVLTAVAATSSAIQLNWTDPNSVESEYRVNRRLSGGTGWTLIATKLADITSHLDLDLPLLTTYEYQVLAANTADGRLAYSNIVEATTLNDLPAAPRLDQATELAWENIYLSWTDQSTNEDGFRVYRRADGGGWTLLYQGTSVSFYDDFSTGGPRLGSVLYEYQVNSYNAMGARGSNILEISDSDGVLPAPTGLAATDIQTDSITIAWIDNSSSGGPGGNESDFLIEYINQTTMAVQTWSRPTDTVSATIPSLDDDIEYAIRVGAHNAALGTYGWSTAILVSTLLATPAAPTGPVAFPSSENPSGRTGYHEPESFEV